MTSGDHYRTLAADCTARARNENDPAARAEWDRMGASYRLLAEQADRNATMDIVYETPPRREQPQAQQQQQPQPKFESDEKGV
jgi:hypothetical protein